MHMFVRVRVLVRVYMLVRVLVCVLAHRSDNRRTPEEIVQRLDKVCKQVSTAFTKFKKALPCIQSDAAMIAMKDRLNSNLYRDMSTADVKLIQDFKDATKPLITVCMSMQ
jgi:hypothetical protein